MARIGGQSPDSYGLSTSVYVTNATENTPVDSNYPLVWDNSAGHSATIAADGESFHLLAKHREWEPHRPVGAWVCGSSDSRVNVVQYSGTAPAIGDAVVADGNGGVKTDNTNGTGRVLFVDTERNQVDLLV